MLPSLLPSIALMRAPAAAVVVRGVLGHDRADLAGQVLVGQVQPHAAESGRVGLEFVLGVAAGRVGQEVLDLDRPVRGVGRRLGQRRRLDVHLVLGRIRLDLVPVHAVGTEVGAGLVAGGAVAFGRSVAAEVGVAPAHTPASRANSWWLVFQSEPALLAWQVRQAYWVATVFQLSPCGVARVAARVALAAVAQVLREADLGVVVLAVAEAPDRVVLAALAVLQRLLEQAAGVDLVRHRRQRQHVAAVGVGGAGVVAGHADTACRRGRRRAAPVSRGSSCTTPRRSSCASASGRSPAPTCRRRRSVKSKYGFDQHRLAGRVGVAQLDRHPVGLGVGSKVTPMVLAASLMSVAEGVGVVAVVVVDELRRRAAVGRGLQRRRQHRHAVRADAGGRGLDPRDVAAPLVRVAVAARYQLGDDQARVGVRQALDHLAVREDGEVDHRRAGDGDCRHAGVLQRHERRRGVDCRVVGGHRRSSGDLLGHRRAGRRGRDDHRRRVAATAAARDGQQHRNRRTPLDQ